MANSINITSVQNINHRDVLSTILLDNTLGNSLTSIEVAISAVETGQIICDYRSIDKTTRYYSFHFTEEEMDQFIALCSYNKTTAPIRYHLRYEYDGQTYNSYKDATFKINANAAVTIKPIAYDTFADTVRLTGDENVIIRGYSVVYANANATFYYGALQQSQSIVCGSRTIGLSSAYIDNPQSGTFKYTITDTNGYTIIETIEKPFIDYTSLTCSLKAALPTTAGTCELKIQGSYFNDTFGAVDNSLALHYRYKAEGEEYGNWITITPTISGHSYTATVTATGLDYQKAYTFQARATDELAIVLSNEDSVRAKPVFDWGKNDFKVNVPLIIPHGAEHGIFSYNSNGDSVNVIQPSNNGDNLVIGWGNYSKKLGNTNIYGDSINLTTNPGNKVSINGYKYGVNNVLWNSGGYAMNASQTATLSQSVSAQAHGIILIFSYYYNNTGDDSHFCSFFVPKEFVATFPGVGMVFNMRRHMVFAPATKYLYITNTKITGHANNWESGTANTAAGVNWANNTFVMRRVIGV